HKFLDHPELRAPCKSDNCVAWTSTIELGETAAGNSDDARKFLFNELGITRSMAHFEIGRRLIHAANDRHSAVVVFVNGQKGIDAFTGALLAQPPPLPKVPFESIIRDYNFPPDAPVMKALDSIQDGGRVFIPIAAGASPQGVAALLQRAGRMEKGYDVH